MGVIYKITNPKNALYIGQTVDFKVRKKRYGWKIVALKQRKLYGSFNKYGFKNHSFEILEDNVVVEKLNEREIFWIKECNSYYKNNRKFGMNLNRGGNTPIWDKVRIENFAEKFRGSKNPFFGKKHNHSKEKKIEISKKISDSMKMVGFKPNPIASIKGAEAKRRAVLLYDTNNDLHSEYISLTECAKFIGVDVTTVRDCLKKEYFIKGKYICRYKDLYAGILKKTA